jgi:hypothetical protein
MVTEVSPKETSWSSKSGNEKGRVHKKKHLTNILLPRIDIFFSIYESGCKNSTGSAEEPTIGMVS